ncbi:hypothetical protein B1748_17355 [Paenibacillus sp. MY03]|uniref:Gfo/Idh/MocA family protein n=1 Tax=Paenibacillus sp. MY03 TaxID=302980 RepID=UPI000B3C5D94|nr:Gfo/Idh/MocA family oxidoreductase [Paenibacillus sp. MY03]OUS75262.1 hypothetical protein B1748_17355 [Paenibacillus sp. MY03]
MEKQSLPIKIGIVGLGRAGWGMHVEELRNSQHLFRIVAGCDPIAERRERLYQEFGSNVYDSVEQLVADPDVELVDIASRSNDHYAHGVMALQAGKDILLEKPMTKTLAEAEKLAETAERLGRKLYVRHNRRFDSDFLHVREIIDSGLLGDIFLIKLYRHQFQRRNDWQTLKVFGGGQLLNWGPHIIDHALQLMQSPSRLAWSRLDTIQAAGDAEDHVMLILEGDNGRVIEIEISGGMPLPAPWYQVYGTRGTLALTDSVISLKYLDRSFALPELKADSGTPEQHFGKTGTFNAAEVEWIEERIPVKAAETDFWQELYASIRRNQVFSVTTTEALQVVRMIAEAKHGTAYDS